MTNIIQAKFGNNTPSSSSDRRPHHPSQQHQISIPNGGWEPVGFDENGYYVILSRKTGQLVTLSPKSLDGNTLRAVVGSEYCDRHYSEYDTKLEKNVFNPSLLAAVIRQECDEIGRVDPTNVRSPGFYGDAEGLVAHFGNEVYQSTGEPIDATPGKFVYVSGPGLGFSFDTPSATPEEIQQLEEVVSGFNFQSKLGSVAVLGWFATAVFGAVVDNRPILAVTAERGSGKTTLLELLSGMLGPQAFRRDGVPTVAQVIYELESRSAALLVDEFEAQGSQKKVVEVFLSLVRTSFTKSSDARIARVASGRMRFYNPPAGVLVAGIALPAFDEAADTRTVRIQMQRLQAEGRRVLSPLLDMSNRDQVEQFGARIRRMLLGRWNVLSAAQKAVRRMLIDYGHEARAADLYSPLIAGYVAITSDTLPDQERLVVILEECQLTSVEENNTQRDSDLCLSVLLNRRVAIFELVEDSRVKSHQRIREVIWRIMAGQADDETRKSLIRQLEKFGLRPMWRTSTREWKLAVAVSEMNLGLRRLMQGTPWSSGGLKDVLLRLPGAIMGQQRIDGMSQKVVELPLTVELVSPGIDEYELPDAA